MCSWAAQCSCAQYHSHIHHVCRAITADRDGLYMRLLLRARARRAAIERLRLQHAAAAAAATAAAGQEPAAVAAAAAGPAPAAQHDQGRLQEEVEAAALAADREVAVVREANMKWEKADKPKDTNHKTEKLQNAAAGKHFPTRFITPAFLHHFNTIHQLREVRDAAAASSSRASAPQQPAAAAGEGGVTDESVGGYASSMGRLDRPTGAMHNLTAAQVWARIVAPALEATGGMSYAEAFLSQVRFHRRKGALPVGGCAVAFSVALALSLVFNRRE